MSSIVITHPATRSICKNRLIAHTTSRTHFSHKIQLPIPLTIIGKETQNLKLRKTPVQEKNRRVPRHVKRTQLVFEYGHSKTSTNNTTRHTMQIPNQSQAVSHERNSITNQTKQIKRVNRVKGNNTEKKTNKKKQTQNRAHKRNILVLISLTGRRASIGFWEKKEQQRTPRTQYKHKENN